jgi:sugar (pentulose or hexulose) kinase
VVVVPGTRETESPALGAAMLASVGAGIHPDVATAAAEMVHVERTIDPDPDRHEQYRFYMDRYTELYPQVKDVMHQLARHVGGGPDA